MFSNINESAFKAGASRFAKTFVACSLALLCFLMAACAAPAQQNADDMKLSPSDYMVKINQISENLQVGLEGFAEAVAAEDISALQSKADIAFNAINEMNALEVPEELADVAAKYSDATASLKDALNEYIALYTEITDATSSDPFDYNSYAVRLEAIQKAYDEGLNELVEADNMASEL